MSARITDVEVIPLAFPDPPLLNAWGLHEPLALRTLVVLHTDSGHTGLGEGWGGATALARTEVVARAVVGLDVVSTDLLERAAHTALVESGLAPTAYDRRVATSPFEVAALDAAGHLVNAPVSALLGGALRDRVDFAGYLFYKLAGHPGQPDDEWGDALDADGVVRQATAIVDRWGVRSLKLKGGVLAPEVEVGTLLALAEAFPEHALRIDPNGAWRPETAVDAASALAGVAEYLEDPVLGMEQMAAMASRTSLPLATNMCVAGPEDLAPAAATDAVSIVLADHHYWGGLRRTRELAAVCDALGLGLSMHSNSHLGVSLAAMVHVAAATPRLSHACDTHYPWNHESDVVEPGALVWDSGAVLVPDGPGLGVTLDRQRVERLHRLWLDTEIRERDDAAYLRRIRPDFDPTLPRF